MPIPAAGLDDLRVTDRLNVPDVFNHLVLPPQLPGQDDDDHGLVNRLIVPRFIAAADFIIQHLPDSSTLDAFVSARDSLVHLQHFYTEGTLSQKTIAQELALFEPGEFILLHLQPQNGAVIIWDQGRSNPATRYRVEAFETSARTEVVLKSAAFEWDFPALAVNLSEDVFADPEFKANLTLFLQQAGAEMFEQCADMTVRADSASIETRNTAPPTLISAYLMPLLLACGSRCQTTVLRKRVRDEAVFTRGSPWRRSPFYLALRVALQRAFLLSDPTSGRLMYKLLMGVVFAGLLRDSLECQSLESSMFLIKKLARRLAKLEMEKPKLVAGSPTSLLSSVISQWFEKEFEVATSHCNHVWRRYTDSKIRDLPSLPSYPPEEALGLSLRNSLKHISSIIALGKPLTLQNTSLSSSSALPPMPQFAVRCQDLAGVEMRMKRKIEGEEMLSIQELSSEIIAYIGQEASFYSKDPVKLSLKILLVFEMWVIVDKRAVAAFHLLRDYPPPFSAAMLDGMHLLLESDMVRLHAVQTYLLGRHRKAGMAETIFSDLSETCFAARSFDASSRVHGLRDSISNWFENEKRKRRKFWNNLTEKYEAKRNFVATNNCSTVTSSDQPYRSQHFFEHCPRCQTESQMREMTIPVLEEPLSDHDYVAKATMFELRHAPDFAHYRTCTARVMTGLCHNTLGRTEPPRQHLKNYEGLAAFFTPVSGSTVTLASRVKSFTKSHYKRSRFPVQFDTLVKKNPLKWRYFDNASGMFLAEVQNTLSLDSYYNSYIPKDSSLDISVLTKTINSTSPISSAAALLSQFHCTRKTNIHEYTAIQDLFVGRAIRWYSVLVELFSNNINISSEAALVIFSRLALQAGPLSSTPGDYLRQTHGVFREQRFCEKLLELLTAKIEVISQSFYENYTMNLVLTLAARVHSLSPLDSVRRLAIAVILKAQQACAQWLLVLQRERKEAQKADVKDKVSQYALWASLLCRKCSFLLLEETEAVSSIWVQNFVMATITMQVNMAGEPDKLPDALKFLLVDDLQTSARLKGYVVDTLVSDPHWCAKGVYMTYPSRGTDFTCTVLEKKNTSGWLTFHLAGSGTSLWAQQIDLSIFTGQLLFDGEPVGSLPAVYANNATVKDLLETTRYLAFRSDIVGMEYQLESDFRGFSVHLGQRDNTVIVRIRDDYSMDTYELIPRSAFGRADDYTRPRDFPANLIDGCFHFLGLSSKELEIRTRATLWDDTPPECVVSLSTFRASVGKRGRLVDPHHPYSSLVASIFRGFEDIGRLLLYLPHQHDQSKRHLYQTHQKTTRVELFRYDLLFYVKHGELFGPQLNAYISKRQAIGCLHGLKSFLTLQTGQQNAETVVQRSIILPMGSISVVPDDCHVAVKISPSEDFARFQVNSALGRLECAAHPELLLLKAAVHAATSSYFDDPLTHRTGSEEALHILRSGVCQPWEQELSARSTEYLKFLANLSPSRTFYPPTLRLMEIVEWNQNMPSQIQGNQFRLAVEDIVRESQRLARFKVNKPEHDPVDTIIEQHLKPCEIALLMRSERRLCLYSRHSPLTARPGPDRYQSREAEHLTKGRDVFKIASACNNPDQFSISQLPELAKFFRRTQEVQGFEVPIDEDCQPVYRTLVGDLLSLSVLSEWGLLVRQFCDMDKSQKYRVMFQSALLAFRGDVPFAVVEALVAFAFKDGLKRMAFPSFDSLIGFSDFETPSEASLVECIKPHLFPPDEPALSDFSNRKQRRREREERAAYSANSARECLLAARVLLSRWPAKEPVELPRVMFSLINITSLTEYLSNHWPVWIQCLEFTNHLKVVTEQLALYYNPTGDQYQLPTQDIIAVFLPPDLPEVVRSLSEVLHSPETIERFYRTPIIQSFLINKDPSVLASIPSDDQMARLTAVINPLVDSDSDVRRVYGSNLLNSFAELQRLAALPKPFQPAETVMRSQINLAFRKSRDQYTWVVGSIGGSINSPGARNRWLQFGRLNACLSPTAMLEELATVRGNKLNVRVFQSLIALGLAVTRLQRVTRIIHALDRKDMSVVQAEMENPPHKKWSPVEYPDWLLFEIDANLTIRERQAAVALEMASPSSGSNSVLQMNMGEGKTSVIIPMVACLLADGSRLARIIVPQSLLIQTAQLLHSRLGGLVGRYLKHIPFTRASQMTPDMMDTYSDIHHQLVAHQGILVCLPEHIMSFQLCSRQNAIDRDLALAQPMVEFQSWLNYNSRDVLDECDYTLAVRTQLIYTSGANTALPGHPHRWKLIQELLRLVLLILHDLQADYPDSIEVIYRTRGEFPFIMFLRPDVEVALVARLVVEICTGRSAIIPPHLCDDDQMAMVRQFLTEARVRGPTFKAVDTFIQSNSSLADTMYLLRGLFVQQILIFAFQKRWNVQYGIHPNRKPMSVPFRAKGVPSEQAEWGHPEVSLLFTCLSFYYSGLTQDQFIENLLNLQSLDDPSTIFNSWVEASKSLPVHLRVWDAIHLEDADMVRNLWEHLKYNLVVVDYFLNNSVFPKHAKQYEYKLAASGWDLIQGSLETQDGGSREAGHPTPMTTGFSGTNDNRDLLPLTIKQVDMPALVHTNAEVLTYLLAPRNERVYTLRPNSSETDLLSYLISKNFRVLIDVGARILEMDNRTLAQTWLRMANDEDRHVIRAAIYFQDDVPFVTTQKRPDGVPLLSSRYVDYLSDCVVYLDQAHTRGTDLNMPHNATGALTLGLDLTKDQVTQAAMRLRQLATSQTIVFVSPHEVSHSIRDSNNLTSDSALRSPHVVSWLLEQTCNGLESLQSLYYFQGMDFCSRVHATLENRGFLSDPQQLETYSALLLQKEPSTLKQLYDPRAVLKRKDVLKSSPSLNLILDGLRERRMKVESNTNIVHGSMFQEVEVEQEHEVHAQVEAVREIQRPGMDNPRTFTGLHRDLYDFVESGSVPGGSHAIKPAFEELKRMFPSAGINGSASAFLGNSPKLQSRSHHSHRLCISTEYFKTLKNTVKDHVSFVRNFRWLLWSESSQTAVILIPEEAEAVLTLLEQGLNPDVYLLIYSAPISREMLVNFNKLNFYSIPELPRGWRAPQWLLLEMGFMCGRVYFEWEEYQHLCSFLGLHPNQLVRDIDSTRTNASRVGTSSLEQMFTGLSINNVRGPTNQPRSGSKPFLSPFPPQFILDYLSILRKGQDFSQTPMNYVLHQRPMQQGFHFFQQPIKTLPTTLPRAVSSNPRQRQANRRSNRDGRLIASDDDDDDDDEEDDPGRRVLVESDFDKQNQADRRPGGDDDYNLDVTWDRHVDAENTGEKKGTAALENWRNIGT